MGGFGSRGGMCFKVPLKSRNAGVAVSAESMGSIKTENKVAQVADTVNKSKGTSQKTG